MRKARRRHPHCGDRAWLPPRRRRELPPRTARRLGRPRARRDGLDDGSAGREASARAARETVERNLTWTGYAKRDPASARRRRRPDDGHRGCIVARGGLPCDVARPKPPPASWRPRSTASATGGAGAADLALFHELAPPPTGRRASVPREAPRERARSVGGWSSRSNRISAGTTTCLFNSFQLRLPPAAPVRARRRSLRPPGRRPDRNVSRVRRRDRRPDRRDQPRTWRTPRSCSRSTASTRTARSASTSSTRGSSSTRSIRPSSIRRPEREPIAERRGSR